MALNVLPFVSKQAPEGGMYHRKGMKEDNIYEY